MRRTIGSKPQLSPTLMDTLSVIQLNKADAYGVKWPCSKSNQIRHHPKASQSLAIRHNAPAQSSTIDKLAELN